MKLLYCITVIIVYYLIIPQYFANNQSYVYFMRVVIYLQSLHKTEQANVLVA